MNPVELAQLVEALTAIASVLERLGIPGLVALALMGPAAVVIAILVLEHIRRRNADRMLEQYRADMTAAMERTRTEASVLMESYRADTQAILRELGGNQEETTRYYRDNVELVKAYRAVSENLQDVVVNNTRIMERVLALMENNMACPIARDGARGRK
ncbi:MAG TPA: hypothetical protein VE028_01580 [Nitratidesulfovibrio sp.]|jgi:ABC-type anion transport system duplicated permease subunit|nr:hypothetical protein [Nitratidesulfovibrio sp.]